MKRFETKGRREARKLTQLRENVRRVALEMKLGELDKSSRRYVEAREFLEELANG